MRTDLNVWMNETNISVQPATFEFINQSNVTGYQTGTIFVPPLEIIGSDVIIGIMIMQTVIMILLLYYTWRVKY